MIFRDKCKKYKYFFHQTNSPLSINVGLDSLNNNSTLFPRTTIFFFISSWILFGEKCLIKDGRSFTSYKKQSLLSFETLLNLFLYELIKMDLSMNIDLLCMISNQFPFFSGSRISRNVIFFVIILIIKKWPLEVTKLHIYIYHSFFLLLLCNPVNKLCPCLF